MENQTEFSDLLRAWAEKNDIVLRLGVPITAGVLLSFAQHLDMVKHPDVALRVIDPPALVRDWKGHTVRSRIKVCNALGCAPAGSLFTIRWSGPTKSLQTMECQACGFSLNVTVGGTRERFEREFDFVELG